MSCKNTVYVTERKIHFSLEEVGIHDGLIIEVFLHKKALTEIVRADKHI